MSAGSAIVALVLAASLWLVGADRPRAGGAVAAFAVLMAVVLCFVPIAGAVPSLAAVVAFVLVGAAIAIIDLRLPGGLRPAELLAFAAAAVALFGAAEWLYLAGTRDDWPLRRASVPSVVVVFVLVVGVFFARAETGVLARVLGRGPAGSLSRVLLPAMVGLPILLGWACLAGVRNELFDAATATALLVTGTAVAFAALVAFQARAIDATHAELRATTRTLDAIIENIPDMIFVKDAERLSFVRINRAGEELLGLRRADLFGKTDRDFFDDGQATFFQDADRKALEAGQLLDIREEPIATPAGERWLHTRKVAIVDDDGRPTHLLGISEDITERRDAERLLRVWASVFEHADWGVAVARDGVVPELMNPAWARMHGYTLAELLDKPLEHVFAPESRPHILEHLAAAAAQGHAAFESRHVRKDGSVFSVFVSLTALEGRGLAVHAQDVTELKRSEDELRRAKETAEATSKELEAFSYSVSHDLRAPLRAIDGFSLALLEDYGDKLDGPGRDYLGRVRGAAQRMAALIDDLIDLSRVARHDISRDRVDLAAMARDIARELAEAAPARAVAFRADGDLTASADPRLLRVALTNLLGNAWKFTSQRPDAHVELGRATDGHFFVRDDGVGFDMTYAANLFGAFQRLHAAAEFPGTGIGLATVQRIIHRHGGRIWGEGKPGEGASFHFTLPQTEDLHPCDERCP